jgi:hypothetical protein
MLSRRSALGAVSSNSRLAQEISSDANNGRRAQTGATLGATTDGVKIGASPLQGCSDEYVIKAHVLI